MIPKELESVKQKGANMGGFVLLLYSIMTDYRNGQRGLKNVVEIGVRWGTSTNSFLYGISAIERKNPNVKLYSIDINDCSGAVSDKNLLKYWEFIQGDSKEVVKNWDKGDVDVLLIDGAHDYESVKEDYRLWEPFVKEGGIILFHDVIWPHKGVTKFFWDEVDYPKSVLPLSKSGLGVIYKKRSPYYKEEKIKYDHKG